MLLVEWFNNVREGWQPAIFAAGVAVGLAAIGLFKWLFSKKGDPSIQQTKIQQRGTDQTAIVTKGNGATVGGRDVHIGIKPDNVLDRYEITLKQLGQSEEKIKNQQEELKRLEEQLSRTQIMADTGRQRGPQPTEEAKDLAAQIEDDAGPYALALRAIATGNTDKADELLDETQRFLDTVQQRKDEAQAKIYIARMQNASYAGRPQDALEYCDKLRTLAGNDSVVIENMAVVYYKNAKYKEAEPLMQRALKIDEASLGKDHPDVARDLNNLALLYKATNLLKEAEPLMRRALKIDEASLGKDHPNVAIDLNNLAQLYEDTNRFEEAEPI